METYLKRKKRVFSLCLPITNLGMSTLGELVQAYEHESDKNLNKSMAMVIKSFPKIQGRRKQKELRKIFSRNFIFLILTFVIVNVQIKALNFEKPHRGGGPS